MYHVNRYAIYLLLKKVIQLFLRDKSLMFNETIDLLLIFAKGESTRDFFTKFVIQRTLCLYEETLRSKSKTVYHNRSFRLR